MGITCTATLGKNRGSGVTRRTAKPRLVRSLAAAAALTVLLVACGGGEEADPDPGLATLEEETTTTTVVSGSAEADTEEAVLAFSQCMRDEGIAEFPDPQFGADGSLDFQRGQADLDRAGIDPQSDEFQAAFESCQGLLEGVALIGGGIDLTEIEDLLLEFAQCMRREGIDMPDPNFDFSLDAGDQFAGSIDFTDPEVQTAVEICQAEVNFESLLEDDE